LTTPHFFSMEASRGSGLFRNSLPSSTCTRPGGRKRRGGGGHARWFDVCVEGGWWQWWV
jgi:hypothetical protein